MNVRTTKIARDLWVNKARSLLIVLALAVGVAAFGLMITGRTVLEDDLDSEYEASRPADSVLIVTPFEAALAEQVRVMDGVEAVEARQLTEARLRSGGEVLGMNVQTLQDFDSALNRLSPGGGADLPPADGAILLERSVKDVVSIGDSVEVELLDGTVHTLTVAGFVNDLSLLPTGISLTATGYITPATAAQLGIAGNFNRLYVAFEDDSSRTAVQQQLTSVITAIEGTGLRVESAPVPEPGKYVLGDSMTTVLFILGALGLLTLILSAFLVSSVMSAVMTQQVPQIGILKSLGARVAQTLSLYFRQVLVFGVLALVVAVPLGMVGAYFLANGVAAGMNFDAGGVRLPPLTLVLQVLSALLVPLAAAAVPIFSGARMTIREAISSGGPGTGGGVAWLQKLPALPQVVNLSVRNTFRRKGRLALTFVALILAGSMFIAVIGIRQSMRDAVNELQGDLNYDVALDFREPLPTDQAVPLAQAVEGAETVEPWLLADGRIAFEDGTLSGSIVIYGVPRDTTAARPGAVSGSWLEPADQDALFINADAQDLDPSLKPGSIVQLNIGGVERDWRIVGVSGRGFVPVAYVYSDELADIGLAGLTNRLVVQSDDSSAEAQAALETRLLAAFAEPGLVVTSSETTAQLKDSTAAQMDTLIVLLLMMVVLVAVVGGLGLAITMSLNVLERTREIGILRSVGAKNGVVRRLVVFEGLIIGILSWAMSIVVSIPLAIWLGNVLGDSLLASPLDYGFSLPGVALWLVLVIVISVIASLVPAQGAARLTIRDALVYE